MTPVRPDLPAATPSAEPERLFTFASGGWVLALMGLICLTLVVWAVAPALMRQGSRPPGDFKHIESYGFDVGNLQVPRAVVVPAMRYRDMVPVMWTASSTGPDPSVALESPERWKPMQQANDLQYGKYLVPGDVVIGVAINGESRAYPQSVMNVHEIINDTLGGTPIAVTYNVPSDSTVVFDRRVDDQTLEFGHSSLVYNSNVLMYDRTPGDAGASPTTQPAEAPSLWSQLLGRAVSGPLAGRSLGMYPAEVTTWADWSKRHPNTTVLNRDLGMAKRYADAAPTQYFNSTKLWFPVDPPPPKDGPIAKTRLVIVTVGQTRRVYRISDILRKAMTSGRWTDRADGVALSFVCDPTAETVAVIPVDGAPENFSVIYAFWFAWHAIHPDDQLAI